MARASTDNEVRINVDLPLKKAVFEAITQMVPDDTLNPGQKVSGVALDLINTLAGGGIFLTAEELRKIENNTGAAFSSADELEAVLGDATGYEAGMMVVKYKIDPAYVSVYQEIADMQERTVADVVRDVIDFVQVNEMAYNFTPQQRPEQVLMTPAMKTELEAILGKSFQNGTELAALVRSFVGAEGLFSGVYAPQAATPSNVRQGA